MTVVFPTPEKKPTLNQQVRTIRARQAAEKRRELKKRASGPTRKSRANDLQCQSIDCVQPCTSGGYANDPELRHYEDRKVIVCANAYMRAWRRLKASQGIPYDKRHVNGRQREREMARRRALRRTRLCRPAPRP